MNVMWAHVKSADSGRRPESGDAVWLASPGIAAAMMRSADYGVYDTQRLRVHIMHPIYIYLYVVACVYASATNQTNNGSCADRAPARCQASQGSAAA